MRPWNATHWKLGPSLWAKGPLKTMRMSAMLYTHTAEPLNTELRKWDAYFQWKPTMGTFTHNLKTHQGKIFGNLTKITTSKVVQVIQAWWTRCHSPEGTAHLMIWCVLAQSFKTTLLTVNRRGFVEDGGRYKDKNNTGLRDLKDLAVCFGYVLWARKHNCSLTLPQSPWLNHTNSNWRSEHIDQVTIPLNLLLKECSLTSLFSVVFFM